MAVIAIILIGLAFVRKSYWYIPFCVFSVIFLYLINKVIMPSTLTEQYRNILSIAEILSLFMVCASIVYIFLMNKSRGIGEILPLILGGCLCVVRIARFVWFDLDFDQLQYAGEDATNLIPQLLYIQYRFTSVFSVLIFAICACYFVLFCKKGCTSV